jgi:photosystem II stability/assembly factor-like uncharacterized protein
MFCARQVFRPDGVRKKFLTQQKKYNLYYKSMKKLYVLLLMLVAMNANAQWVQTSGIPWGAVSFASSGSNLIAGTQHGTFLSTNNGSDWLFSAFNNLTIPALAVSGDSVYACSVNGLYLSTNNGSNWSQTQQNTMQITSLATNGSFLFGGNNSGVYRSTNKGVNWNITSLSNCTVYALTMSENTLFASFADNVMYNPFVYRSTNNGVNWTDCSSGLPNDLVTAILISGNTIFAGCSYGVYKSTNNGNTWAQTAMTAGYINCFAAFGNNVFTGKNNGVYLTTNNGSNWTEFNQGFSGQPTVNSLLISNNYIYAGIYGGVWRRPLSDITRIQNISTETPSKYSLSQNYPNPFNSSSKFKFQNSKLENVKISVYDVQGREVQTLVNERLQPGTYEATFNTESATEHRRTFGSGVYFYKLTTDGYTETKKMLLIK